MCFNKEVSLLSFIISIIGGLTLIKCGNPEYIKTNQKIALFFMWVGVMQLLEFLIWIDLDCRLGWNRLAGLLGPLFNYLQPIIFIFLFYQAKLSNFSYIFIVYLGIVLFYYLNYLCKGKFCSYRNHLGHLSWSWSQIGYLPFIYCIITLLLGYYVYLLGDFYVNVTYLLGICLWIISYFKFNQNLGELWCFFVVGIPVVILLLQKVMLLTSVTFASPTF